MRTVGRRIAAVAVALIFSQSADLSAQRHRQSDVIETARSAGQFSTLLAAVEAAGLTHALQGRGPFTVFAPTDEAFDALPEGTVESLLQERNRARLSAILSYHVVPGRVTVAEARNLRAAETLSGQRLDIDAGHGSINIDEATVIAADVEASNGIIHVIDRVMLPETGTIPEVADAADAFMTLLAAVSAAGLADDLAGEGPFTVFAPTDDAFAKLPAGTVESLLEEENLPRLRQILAYHVVPGRVFSTKLLADRSVASLAGGPLRAAVTGGRVTVNGVRLVTPDIDAANGVIHVIEEVLLPPEGASAMQAAVDLIDLAIRRGVPLYNGGQPEGCAAVYEVAATSLQTPAWDLPAGAARRLQRGLQQAANTHQAGSKAWRLREALDDVREILFDRMAIAQGR